MGDLELTIDLLPKGAWSNNLSKLLPKKDWDTLRQVCYTRAHHRCAICSKDDVDLDAHEVWEFDIKRKTQALKDIVALCSACHGVKHMRNSERIGYGENAKNHFLRVNKCSQLVFASHYAEAQFLFEERNQVLRWKLQCDLDKFGGKGIEVKERTIPFINDPYEGIYWKTAAHVRMADKVVRLRETGEDYIPVVLSNEASDASGQSTAMYAQSQPIDYIGPPKIRSIEVDNYQGTITVVSNDANKIEWISDDKNIKTKYNTGGKFITKISVEDLRESNIRFVLFGAGGTTASQIYGLKEI